MNFKKGLSFRRKYIILCVIIILTLYIVFAVHHVKRSLSRQSLKRYVNMSDISRHGNVSSPRKQIPRIIHQTNRNYDIPSVWNASVQAVMQLNAANFKYKRWSHDDMDTFVREHEPEFYENLFTKYTYEMQRIDSFRYVMMYHIGGIYIDMDSACYRRLIEYVNALEAIETDSTYTALFPEDGIFGVQTEFFIGSRGHPLFRKFIDTLPRFHRNFLVHHLTILLSAGPLYASVQEHFFAPTKEATVRHLANQIYSKDFWKTAGGTWFASDTIVILHIFNNRFLILYTFEAILFLSLVLCSSLLISRKYPKQTSEICIRLKKFFNSLMKLSKSARLKSQLKRMTLETRFSKHTA